MTGILPTLCLLAASLRLRGGTSKLLCDSGIELNLAVPRDVLGLLCLAEDGLRLPCSAGNMETSLDKGNTDVVRVHSGLIAPGAECGAQKSYVSDLERHVEVDPAENAAVNLASAANKATWDAALRRCTFMASNRESLDGVVLTCRLRLFGRMIILVQLFVLFVR